MSAAGARWNLIVYGSAKHSFTNADANSFGSSKMAYDEDADRHSWLAAMDFIDAAFKASSGELA